MKCLKFNFSASLWLLTVFLARIEFSRHEYLIVVVFAYQYFLLSYSVQNPRFTSVRDLIYFMAPFMENIRSP